MDSGRSFEQTTLIVQAAKDGDADALGRLMRHYQRYVEKIVAIKMGYRREGFQIREDVVQEAFVAAIKGLPKFRHRGEGSFKAWLTRVVHNTVIDHVRKAQAQKNEAHRERAIVYDATSGLTPSRIMDVRSATASQVAVGHELRERMDVALQSLSETDREVVILSRFHRCTFDEIAEQLNLGTASSARAKLSRALARLSEALGTDADDSSRA